MGRMYSSPNGCDVIINPSRRFQTLLKGINKPGDCHNSPTPPQWLNRQLFEKGRKFCKKYFVCIMFSELLGLIIGSCFKRLVLPTIFTKYSNTPNKALRRYVSTVNRITKWFEEDVWDPKSRGHEDIMNVRMIHLKVSEQIKKAPTDVSLIYEKLECDFDLQCPFNSFYKNETKSIKRVKFNLDDSKEPAEYLSQFDMALTQYCFIGLIITHPEKLGLWWTSDMEMESFIHFWRGIGWLLGIEDDYNLCNGTYKEVRALCLEIESKLVMPNLIEPNAGSYTTSDTFMRGINKLIPVFSYPSIMLYILTIFNIPNFSPYVSWTHYSYYLILRFIFGFLFIFPLFIKVFNNLLKIIIKIYKCRYTSYFK
ncbi:hypothetical protein Avbf_15032 [Armadillidium vulgare]|nr:hypothetical protein Avbf_15032 [Armadillidium vulgare]